MRKTMRFFYKLLLYFTILAFIFYLSHYCTLLTMSFLHFSNRLIHLTSTASVTNNQFHNLLRVRTSTLRFINLPFCLPLIVARRTIPPFDRLCHKIGDMLNFLKNKSISDSSNIQLDQNDTANVQLSSFSDVQQESNNWSLHDKEPCFKNNISLNTLNFVGCLIFVLIFLIYFSLFTSFFVFFLDRTLQSLGNMEMAFEKMNPDLLTNTAGNKLSSTVSNINNEEFNKNSLKTHNVDFIDY